MSRYIDADKIIFQFSCGVNEDGFLYVPFGEVKKSIADTPNADVEEVRHGKWSIGIEQSGDAYAHCSACNRKMNGYCYGYPHCPMCGAIMDGEQ